MKFHDYDPDDPDAPEEMDIEDDEEEFTVDCANCGGVIHEDAAICPHCGDWVVREGQAARRARGWCWPTMGASLFAVILVMWVGLGRG